MELFMKMRKRKTKMSGMAKKSLGLTSLLAAVAAIALLSLQGISIASDDTGPGARSTLGDMIASPETEEEMAGNQIIRDAFKNTNLPGIRGHFKNRRLVRLSYAGAAWLALEKDLSLRLKGLEENIAQEALLEAKAVFDPVFDLAVSFSESDTYTRSAMGKKTLKKIIFRRDVDSFPSQSNIKRIEFLDQRPEQVVDALVDASTSQKGGSRDSWTFSVGVSQQLPWGPSLNITTVSTHRNTYYDDLNHTFEAPWASSVSAVLSLPLPGSMRFGPYSTQDVGVKLADVSRDRAFWEVKSAINSVLLTVDHAFWDLVHALKNLEATIKNRENLEKLVEHTIQLYKAERTTKYGKFQAEAELARVRALEESDWNSFVIASNALINILDYKPDAVFIPTGYSEALKERLDIDPGPALATGLDKRPALNVSRIALKYKEIEKKYRDTLTRPDLNFTGRGKLSQNNLEYGYKSFTGSLKNLFNEDAREQTYSMSYNYPLGNRALNAAASQARVKMEDQENAVLEEQNLVVKEINNALASLYSARARVEITGKNLKLAELAFRNGEELRLANRLTEFEIMLKSSDLLDADFRSIEARINNKKAQSQLLYSQGILADHLAYATAGNEFDRYRIGLLWANKALKYFGGVKKKEE